MTYRHRAVVGLLLLLLAHRQELAAQASRGALARETFAIADVSLISMAVDTVLSDATVLVRDGRIVATGPSRSVRIPRGARRIDGRGKYLVPGFADMHAHLYSDDEVPDSVAPYELGVMLANGITITRLMMGTPEQLALRKEVESGRVLGPQLWLASPEFAGRRYGGAAFKGYAVSTPEEARAAVREVKAAGYDFLKLTLFVTRPAYDALVDEARQAGIKIVGHVPPEVGVPHALASGQQIEHLDNYLEQVLADSAPMRVSVSDRGVFQPSNWLSLDFVDDAKVARIAGLTARSGAFTSPTLTIFKNAFAIGQSEEAVRARPDWKVMAPGIRAAYLAANTRYWANPPSEARRNRWVEVRNRLTKLIADSGGKIMAGSDAPEWLFTYGWTLHRELESLVSAGLTPFQALRAATRTPAEFLGASAEWGTIETGKRADLVLLSGNPLQDIRNTLRIEGVSIGGRWLDRARLDEMIRVGGELVSR
ncbi:MAG: amidohydrolase family protein [Gemmatimonadales bacterium]|nr:amidohydrolase family protein [Gemmatimonadales bacterium]